MGIKFENADEVFDAITKQITNGVREGITQACLIVEYDAKVDCPVDDGVLRQSITHSVEEEEGMVVGYVGTNVEYAPYVHQGTGIYAVEGNGRKEVPWVYKGKDGKFYSTKGIKPRPFIYNAMEKNRSKIVEKIREARMRPKWVSTMPMKVKMTNQGTRKVIAGIILTTSSNRLVFFMPKRAMP